ncbi:class I SAM-dependent RNA methyltransferase [Corynebacterium uberis]|uniref:class I SAM-dependent RNA methyltransferase n=1 Tax=Corynebacterium TaxID=1716 RepID=UPI001D0B9A93|nr:MULTISPECIES: TRAM domain-containing protein [Corynebacterium]MCZ9308523.1 TRAM domain-containing protein [Corynebacterium sp. c6VSa_13]UDL74175.1 TRAM domain-containing protein [Corynebacterium uberis]UDL74941.1 TRAM domain-containing protein [Corynebacterium uberis]UDL77156.1 TRAM domain-containing protein [Corynebacterium uberis]UDL79438.1 TRAM domain-containing protein [Corynebacterium uberis]
MIPTDTRETISGVRIERMAHGGRGIALIDARVVFVAGAFPGDVVTIAVHKKKKRFWEATAVAVEQPSELRGEERCPAAAAGAGCCDFSAVRPDKELELKAGILRDQLGRIGALEGLPEPTLRTLEPVSGWRSRARLGVDKQGRAGTRKAQSTAVVTDVACSQLVPGLARGIVGEDARRFTPGAEVIAVMDDAGERHVLEARAAARGRRTEKTTGLIEGSGTVTQTVGATTFRFPATAFWQAHVAAPGAYAEAVAGLLRQGLERYFSENTQASPVGWDLYGGVGLFIPTLRDVLGADAQIYSVDYSAAASGQAHSWPEGVTMVNARVDAAVSQLPRPDAVILDPPRSGAGAAVIAQVAQARPRAVVHIGCDPATLARDLGYWSAQGMTVAQMQLIDAFPGTHHFEVLVLLVPAATAAHK